MNNGEYKENPEIEIPMVERLFDRFKNCGLVMPQKQQEMYHAIKKDIIVHEKFSVKKTIVDVGCGTGIGSNILSQEAKFVWGIDKSEESINFAKQMFEREKMPQITFDVVDINTFPRETMKFGAVVMIEVLEHIKDYQLALDFIKKRLCKEDTKVYISSPNRNSPELQKDTPENKYHCKEFTAAEFYDILIKNFKVVMLYNHNLTNDQDLDSQDTPLLAKCSGLIL